MLQTDPRWPRIARILDRGFDLRPSDRIRSVAGLTQSLTAVDTPLPPSLQAELSMLEANVAANEKLAAEQRVSDALRQATDAAVGVIEDVLYGRPLEVRTSRTSYSPRHDTVEVQFFQPPAKLPVLEGSFECGHEHGKWSGVYRLPHLQPTKIFETAEEETVAAEMTSLAQLFLGDALRMMNLRYAAVRDASVPLALRNLVFAYPVALVVTAEVRGEKLVVRFGLRNNATRPLEDVELHVLAPTHLAPETAVPTSSDEERWLRCLPPIVPNIDVDQAIADVCEVTVSKAHGADDSFIFSVTTAPYRWTGGIQLKTLTGEANG